MRCLVAAGVSLPKVQLFSCMASLQHLFMALMDLIDCYGWTISELSKASRVSRSMITGVQNLTKFGTTATLSRLCVCFGMELFEFDLLASFELCEEMAP